MSETTPEQGATPDPRDAQIAELQRQLAELQPTSQNTDATTATSSTPEQPASTSTGSSPQLVAVQIGGTTAYGFPVHRREVDLRDANGDGEHYHQVSVALLSGDVVAVSEHDVDVVTL